MNRRNRWFKRNSTAEDLLAAGNRAEARELLEQNVEEGCTVAYTFQTLSTIYLAENRFDDAQEAIDRAIEIESERGPSSTLVRLKRQRKRVEERKERADRQGGSAPRREQAHGASPRRHTTSNRPPQRSGCFGSSAVLLFTLATLLFGLTW